MVTGIKIFLSIIMIALVAYLANMLINDIKGPIEYDTESKARKAETVEKLKDLRTAQLFYKRKNRTFSGDMDSLITFVKTDSIRFLKAIGDPNDSTVVTKKEERYVSVLDSLYDGDSMRVNNMQYIPYTDKKKFNIEQGQIEKNKVKVKVFEISTDLNTIFDGLNKKYFDPNELLKVGSMTEASTAGNWE